ncbi:hypothetical protein AWV79_04705 [Cupriavidus sp. UYMMa02A]|nr:hypothetical protein AWV79_04705 [Cupriavidus sp. UYMMa02A]
MAGRKIGLQCWPITVRSDMDSYGDYTMVTKQEDAFIVKNLIALAAVETIGAAIALGLVFNVLT